MSSAQLAEKLEDNIQDTIFQDPFAVEIWSTTYKDYKDETIDDTFYRVAENIASAEAPELRKLWTNRFYDMLTEFKCTVGGRIYSNAGTEWGNKGGTTLINCTVSPRGLYDIDSIEEIMRDVSNQTFSLKSETGWGQNFSWLRPRGAFIHGIGVETPGAVKYMEIYDKTSDIITAGSGKKSSNKKAKGKIRKGAMMGILDCVAGTTLINTLSGKTAIKDLVGTHPYLYCTDGNGNVFIRQAESIWSKGKKKTIKVMFDNDDYIECTPEHEFMLSDGSFIKAKDLKQGYSLAAINKRLQNGYLYVGVSGSRKRIAEHNTVYEMKYGQYPSCLGVRSRKNRPDLTIAHHIDESKTNNHPDNIASMTLREHAIIHKDEFESHRARIAADRKGKKWEEYYGEDKARDIKEKYTKKRKSSTPWNRGLTGDDYKTHYENGFSNQFVENSNHKVLKIEDSIEQEVFDIAMPAPYHNFAANGVFIHNCTHPDIIEFITAKQQPGRLTKFNVSVNCTDEFMNKVLEVMELKKHLELLEGAPLLGNAQRLLETQIEEADRWNLRFPDTQHEKYKSEWDGDLGGWEAKGYPVIIYNTVSAIWLWNLIMESTYARAEPGILFIDRANYYNPLNYAEKIMACNPCAEQVLAPGNICCLGSLNLTQFVKKDRTGFDLTKLKKYTRYLNRFLDNVDSVSHAPLPEYIDSMRNKRRVGIGVLGWGSALFMMKIRFGSKHANELRDELISTIAREAYMSSIDLAEEKGMFSLCEPEKHILSPFISGLDLPEDYMIKLKEIGIRNSSLLSCQPTGNTSILANVVSGGIEPIFMPEYIRTVIENHMPDHIKDITPKWYEGEWHETSMFNFTKEGDEEILKGTDQYGTVYKIDKNRGLTKEVACEDYGVRFLKQRDEWDPNADWAVTTSNLGVQDHVNDLKGFARWIDSSLSKTCNVPHDYPFEDFKNIYLDAYKSQYVKGITTYRAGTMVTVLAAKDEKTAEEFDEEIIVENVKLPVQSPSMLNVIRAEGKKWYLTVVMNEQQTRPVAFFVQTNHSEKEATTSDAVERLLSLARDKAIPDQWVADVERKISGDNNTTKIARCISLCLRHGILIKNVVAELEQVEDVFVGSFLFQITKFLSRYIKDGEKVENGNTSCASCGGAMIYQEGCKKCSSCGHSKCG